MMPTEAQGHLAQPNPSRYAVLYVDDEEQALKYFRKAYSRDFQILTATSVDEALALLECENAGVGVVLSDHRMPGKTGTELLARVKVKWPHIVRILVTAYADTESAVEAVNAGAVYKYLAKPIDLVQTRQLLIDAIELFARGRDQEALLTNKGDLIERAIVADRMQSMAAMASGVSHHVRNSLTAVNCFFEEMREKVAAARTSGARSGTGGPGTDDYLDKLLVLANDERVRLCQMIDDIEARGARANLHPDDSVEVAELVSRAVEAAKNSTTTIDVRAEGASGGARITVDAAAVVRMLGTLIVHADRYCPKGSTIRVLADGLIPYWGTAAARIRILGDGVAWKRSDVAAFFMPFPITTQAPNDTSLEMLEAFQTALGHEGDIIAHPAAPAGPGFEVRLPLNPAAVRRPALTLQR